VQYCEYFHLLDADMQRTNDLSAQRYSARSGGVADSRVRATEHDKCFSGILSKCLDRDRPLVRLEGEGSDALVLDDGSGGAGSRRVLRDADLAMVRSRIRAAAYSSNLRVAAEEGGGRAGAGEPPLGFDGPAPQGRGAAKHTDPSTCAAAIETLLWFGLALGENGSRSADGKGKKSKQGAVPLAELCGGALDDFALDCAQAMREAGLTDEAAANEALAAVTALQERHMPVMPAVPALGAEGGAPAKRTPSALRRVESSSSHSTATTAELDISDSPEEKEPERKSRSGRSFRPPRIWPSAAGTPLLKWEKEQQLKGAAGGRKRRVSKELAPTELSAAEVRYAPPSRLSLGDDTCSDSSSESGSVSGVRTVSTADLHADNGSDFVMSDLGLCDEQRSCDSSPKRQHVGFRPDSRGPAEPLMRAEPVMAAEPVMPAVAC